MEPSTNLVIDADQKAKRGRDLVRRKITRDSTPKTTPIASPPAPSDKDEAEEDEDQSLQYQDSVDAEFAALFLQDSCQTSGDAVDEQSIAKTSTGLTVETSTTDGNGEHAWSYKTPRTTPASILFNKASLSPVGNYMPKLESRSVEYIRNEVEKISRMDWDGLVPQQRAICAYLIVRGFPSAVPYMTDYNG